MDRINIEPGCELPADGECVLVFAVTWEKAECEAGRLYHFENENPPA